MKRISHHEFLALNKYLNRYAQGSVSAFNIFVYKNLALRTCFLVQNNYGEFECASKFIMVNL